MLGTLLAFLSPAAAHAADSPWSYVVPAAGDPFEHPPLRIVSLSRQKPADLKETVRYRGKTQRYAQIHYGSHGSVRVTLVLDEIAAGEVDLYVDANRTRTIGPRDRMKGANGIWRVPLDVALVQDSRTTFKPRTVLFRLGRVSRTLSFATCGYLEGKTRLGDRTVAVRRVDGDGNGFFADLQDRLWIDLDGDGRWDPLQEQFLYAPILTFGAARYAVRSDPLGKQLKFRKLEGTGTVCLSVEPAVLAQRIEELTATLMGRDGSVFTLRGHSAEATLPVGDYRLSVVTLSLKDPDGGSSWNFVFSDSGTGQPPRWYTVNKGSLQRLDPIGKLQFLAGLSSDGRTCRPGKSVTVQPRLYTGDGLLINTAYRSSDTSGGGFGGCSGEIVLASAAGTPLSTHSSGFA